MRWPGLVALQAGFARSRVAEQILDGVAGSKRSCGHR